MVSRGVIAVDSDRVFQAAPNVQHLVSGPNEPLPTRIATMVLTTSLHRGQVLLVLLVLVVVDHGGVQAHALDHATATTSFLSTVLIMKLLDELKEVVVDLVVVALGDLLLFFSVDVDLRSEDCLSIATVLWSAAPGKLIESSSWDLGRYHCSVCRLLLDRDHHFPITLCLRVHFGPICCLVRRMRRCVQIRVLLHLLLVLHLELSEESLFKLCLLRRADRLARHAELLVEKMLVEFVAVDGGLMPAEVHGIVCAIRALVAQALRVNR